jgi:hypothetical protein
MLSSINPVFAAQFDDTTFHPTMEDDFIGLLNDLQFQMSDQEAPTVFWLCGSTGSGKTTLARLLCQEMKKLNRILARFCVERCDAGGRTANSLVTTLVHQLAVSHPDLMESICENLSYHKDILESPVKDQIDILLVDPLIQFGASQFPVVLVIDGLDHLSEGEANSTGGDLIPQLLHSMDQLSNVKLLVTSKPSPNIAAAIDELPRRHYWRTLLPELFNTTTPFTTDVAQSFEQEMAGASSQLDVAHPQQHSAETSLSRPLLQSPPRRRRPFAITYDHSIDDTVSIESPNEADIRSHPIVHPRTLEVSHALRSTNVRNIASMLTSDRSRRSLSTPYLDLIRGVSDPVQSSKKISRWFITSILFLSIPTHYETQVDAILDISVLPVSHVTASEPTNSEFSTEISSTSNLAGPRLDAETFEKRWLKYVENMMNQWSLACTISAMIIP